MPELVETMNPSLPDVLAATAWWAQGEEEYWRAELDRLGPAHLIEDGEIVLIRIGPFLDLPLATERRLLRRAIERVRGSLRSIDFRHVEAIRQLMQTREGSGRIQLPDLDIYRSFDWLRLAPVGFDSRLERDFEAPLTVPGRTEIPARGLTLEMELVSGDGVYNEEMQALDWERCTGSLRVRNWRPGDQYQAQGRTSAAKIKTLFQDERVPLWERRAWPVIVRNGQSGDEILWSRGFGAAASVAAEPDSRKILLIRELTESKPGRAASMLLKRARLQDPEERAESRAAGSSRVGEPGAEVL